MSGRYCYDHPHPAVTTDVVVLTIADEALRVLLIERGAEPFKGHWALPGGFLEPHEDLDRCAERELEEETGLCGLRLHQVHAFSRPDRDPRDRVVSVAYLALTRQSAARAGSDAAASAWHRVAERPRLAFDHDEIIEAARRRLIARLGHSALAFDLLPPVFTLAEVKRVHEVLLGAAISDRRFRDWMLAQGRLEETGDRRTNGSGPATPLYQLKTRNEEEPLPWPRTTS